MYLRHLSLPYYHIIFLYYGAEFLVLVTIDHSWAGEMTLFTTDKTVPAPSANLRSNETALVEIAIYTLVARFELVYTPLFDIEELVIQGHR